MSKLLLGWLVAVFALGLGAFWALWPSQPLPIGPASQTSATPATPATVEQGRYLATLGN